MVLVAQEKHLFTKLYIISYDNNATLFSVSHLFEFLVFF